MSDREIFRRSALTLAPHWGLAAGLALIVLWAAHHFDLLPDWEGLLLAVPALAWAAGQTLQWAATTWTATDDGHLIVRKGILFRSQEAIPLRLVRQAHVRSSLPGPWPDVGHLSLEVAAPHGLPRSFRWAWLGRADRLAQILRARGRLPVGQPSRRQRAAGALWALGQAVWARRPWSGTRGGQQPAPDLSDEYQRFLAFCHFLLSGQQEIAWPPAGVPLGALRRWLSVLRQARIVVDAPGEPGWRLARTIRSLDDVRRRVGEEELWRAMQRPA